MSYTVVKRHNRVVRNKNVSVRKHSRSLKTSTLVKHFKNRYGIKSGITVGEGKYADPEGTSMAMTASRVSKNGEPISHDVKLKTDKIASNGENPETIIHHELSHVLVREKKLVSVPEYKRLINAIQKTQTYKNLGNAYGKDKEELFARAYSQVMTGDTTSNDYLFSPKEIKVIKPFMDKLLTKVTGTKQSKK